MRQHSTYLSPRNAPWILGVALLLMLFILRYVVPTMERPLRDLGAKPPPLTEFLLTLSRAVSRPFGAMVWVANSVGVCVLMGLITRREDSASRVAMRLIIVAVGACLLAVAAGALLLPIPAMLDALNVQPAGS